MVNSSHEYYYYIADEEDLNDLVEGSSSGPSYAWPGRGAPQRIPLGHFGVLCEIRKNAGGYPKPCVLVVHEDDERRLFARFSQLRSDLSPLSSWVHIVRPRDFESVRSLVISAELDGLEAAWAGLAIAEASILSRRSQSRLKQSACLATQTFALARSLALWGVHDTTELLDSYDRLLGSLRGPPSINKRTRAVLEPIWAAMMAVNGAPSTANKGLVGAISAIRNARLFNENEISALQFAFDFPETAFLEGIESKGPEERLREFDRLRAEIRDSKERSRCLELAFVAGYLATIAAGGSSSLTIAEAAAEEHPEILAFAYLIGGLGEQRSWSGGFDGLGRLVARELMRSCNLADGPTADFSAAEAGVLIDRALNDPLVFLKVKQSRIVTVSFLPGVNVQFPLAEAYELPSDQTRSTKSTTARASQASDPIAALADALLPYLLDKLPQAPSKSQARSNKRPVQKRLKL